MAAVWSFCWLGHCSDFVTVQTWWWIGPVFVLIHHGHRLTSCVDVRWDCLYSSRKHQHPDDDARTGPRCHGLLVSFSLTVHYAPTLTVYKCILSPCFIFRCLPTPYRPPSRSQASLRNAYAPLASHGFMLWGQNVLTPGPSLFTASLLAGFFFWRRQLQSEKSSHWGGTVYSLGLGGKPLIQSFPICSVFWIGIWMGLEIEGCP